jgi:hypothetical protein
MKKLNKEGNRSGKNKNKKLPKSCSQPDGGHDEMYFFWLMIFLLPPIFPLPPPISPPAPYTSHSYILRFKAAGRLAFSMPGEIF